MVRNWFLNAMVLWKFHTTPLDEACSGRSRTAGRTTRACWNRTNVRSWRHNCYKKGSMHFFSFSGDYLNQSEYNQPLISSLTRYDFGFREHVFLFNESPFNLPLSRRRVILELTHQHMFFLLYKCCRNFLSCLCVGGSLWKPVFNAVSFKSSHLNSIISLELYNA